MKTGDNMNMMATTFGRNTAASNMIIEDHIKKVLTTAGKQKTRFVEAKNSKLVPRMNHSPFGDFPKDYTVKKRGDVRKEVYARQMGIPLVDLMKKKAPVAEPLSVTAHKLQTLHKGQGIGGKPFSLNKKASGPAARKPRAGAKKRRTIAISEFRRYYDRRDFPIVVEHTGSGCRLKWINDVDLAELDYHHYLPIFFEGLREKQDPYRFLAIQGIFELLEHGGARVLPVIPQLIIPIKSALNSRDEDVISITLKVL